MFASYVNTRDLIEIISADAYSPDILEVIKMLTDCSKLGTYLKGKPRLGITGTIENEYVDKTSDGAVPYITTKQTKDIIVYPTDCKYISKKADNLWKKCRVFDGQIIINKSGNVGMASMLRTYDYKYVNSVSDIININIHEDKIDPYFLVLYLNSVYGQKQLQRLGGGAVFDHISIFAIPDIKIKNVDMSIQVAISNKIRKAEIQKRIADTLFNKASKIGRAHV